jgi:hypothetical protein
VVALLAVGGAFWGLRANSVRPFAGAPAANQQVAKPQQAAVNPAGNAAASSGATAQPAQPAPAAQPAQVAASPAAKPAPASASPVTQPVAAQPSPGASSTGRLLFADDFSDPSRGIFPNNLQGIGRITGDGSAPPDFQGNYAYQGGAMVGKLIGDHPGGDRAVFGRMLLANERLVGDFAVEVRGRVTSSPNATRFGFQYQPTQGEFFTFTVFPGTTGYNISLTGNQTAQSLATGRTPAMRPPGEDNLLRIEIQGDTARMYVNRQEVGRAQHQVLGRRDGQISLNMAANGQLANRTAEVEFRDFKAFSLAP